MARPKLRRLFKIALFLVIALALLLWVAFTVIVPRLARTRIKESIEAQGYGPVRLLTPDIGLYRTTVANLSIGNPAHPQVELASATVTYTPARLLAGQVDDILLSGLVMRIEPPAPAASAPASRSITTAQATTEPIVLPAHPTTAPARPPADPPFRSAKLTNARLEFVDPATGLPTSVLLDAQAKAGKDRTIDFSVHAGFGALQAEVTGSADPSFEVVDADITVRGITLEPLRVVVPSGIPAKLTQPAEIDAKVHLDRTGPQLDLQNLTVRIPRASIDAGEQERIDLRDTTLSLAGSLHRYGSDWYLAVTRGPDLTIDSVAPPAPFRPLPVALSFAPTRARFGANGSWGISCEGASLDIDRSRFGLDLRPFTIASSRDGVIGALNAQLRDIELGRNPVIEKIIPDIRQWNVSGRLSASIGLQLDGQAFRPRVGIRLANANLENTDYQLRVKGVNADFALTNFSPVQTDVDQTISADYIQMGKWEIVSAEAKFTVPGESQYTIRNDSTPAEGQIVKVNILRFGWAGGDVWSAPFDLNLAHPRIRTELGAKDLDLSKIVWVASNQMAWAEGLVDLKLWADYSWPELRFGNGWAASRPDWRIALTDPNRGRAVVLHLPDSAQQLDNWFRMRDPRFQDDAILADIRRQIVGTISDFEVNEFRADFSRSPAGKQISTIHLRGGGQADKDDAHRLNLTITATDVDLLISHFLKVKSDTPDEPATQPTTQSTTQPATTQAMDNPDASPATGKAGVQ